MLISGIVVFQATRREASGGRMASSVVGTAIGAIMSGAYLCLLPFSVIGMAVCIAVTVLLCGLFGIPDDGRLASITVAVIMVVSTVEPSVPPLTNAMLRFVESCIGASVGGGFVYVLRRA